MPRRNGAVHVATIKRRYKDSVYTTHLLRRSYRADGQVLHETLGNISHLPEDLVETIRIRLKTGTPNPTANLRILRSMPHGHVALVLGLMRQIGLENILESKPGRMARLTMALIASRILFPGSKLACARALQEQTATCSLASELGLESVRQHELYEAMDWLLERQSRIERKLAHRHLEEGTLLLYDLSSSYYTGKRSALVDFGHNRDGKRRFPQIVYGLLCNAQGCPIAIEVFSGNTADPKTLASQIAKVRSRFGIQRVVWVGDRGMLTTQRIQEELRPVEGLEWISALRTEAIRKLVQQRCIEPSLFDKHDLAQITSPDFPGERLIVCFNPLLCAERRRKRSELLAATEKELEKIRTATGRKTRALRGKAAIGLRAGRVLGRYRMAKHFILEITEEQLSYRRNTEKIQAEENLDGIYVIRTSLNDQTLGDEDTVRAYKDLSKVERAFRSLKTVDLKIRPIYHWLDDRIRAHVFVCLLAYYVEWHLRQRVASVLFEDTEREAAEQQRESVVAPAPRSSSALAKEQTKKTSEGWPVHSFQTLLQDLATLVRNQVSLPESQDPQASFYMNTEPTAFQRHVFELAKVQP